MASDTVHSPLPWRVYHTQGGTSVGVRSIGNGARRVCYMSSVGKGINVTANAAFICRAVNSFDELLAALKAYVAACDQQDIKLGSITGDAEAAIAKAEHKE